MRNPLRRRPADTPAAQLWEERGTIITHRTLTSAEWQTHPNDLRLRVFPDGPYDKAWAGVQKDNPIAHIGIGHAHLDYSPLRSARMSTGATMKDNPTPDFFGSGPYTASAANQADLDYYRQAQAQQSIWQTILGRLRGG